MNVCVCICVSYVAGYQGSVHKGFETIAEARKNMVNYGVSKPPMFDLEEEHPENDNTSDPSNERRHSRVAHSPVTLKQTSNSCTST